jgi:uncharacterized RDD family membrane protein YckC
MAHDSPISLHGKGPTLARQAVEAESGHWPIPEGTVLAPLWKRGAAFMLDVIAVIGVLSIVTRFQILSAFDQSLILTDLWWVFLLNWGLIFAAKFLYQKYLVNAMGRSLGQYWFGLAVVREDGERLPREDCERRAVSKLRYLIPLLNLWWFYSDAKHIHLRHTHQSNIDLACASIVVVANSLPPAKRRHLR